jgi:hypothetical protein
MDKKTTERNTNQELVIAIKQNHEIGQRHQKHPQGRMVALTAEALQHS